MRKHNVENERIKREYLRWIGEAQGCSEATLDHAAGTSLGHQADTGYRPFTTFNRERAVAFKRRLVEARHPTTGKPLSQATVWGQAEGCPGVLRMAFAGAGLSA